MPLVMSSTIYQWRQQEQLKQKFLLVNGADTTNATITGLITGATYSISVASTSGSTETAAPRDVTIGM